jgi:toxin-antitoxin system PIN domain toxin
LLLPLKTRMISYSPDINTWLALTWEGHVHHSVALAWSESIPAKSRLLFSRYSQLGLLRLVTNSQVMGGSVISLGAAFALYDSLIEDPRIELAADPPGLDQVMRAYSRRPLSRQSATKAIGDLYLTAFGVAAASTTVTFDKAMARVLQAEQAPVILLKT